MDAVGALGAILPAGALNLGSAQDWTTMVGAIVSALGLLAAVWKLARASAKLEAVVVALQREQEIQKSQYEKLLASQDERYEKQAAAFSKFQQEITIVTHDLQMSVNRLTWEMQRGPDRRKPPEA